MKRYAKRVIAILAVALMCSSFIGGGVLAGNENESGMNDELTFEGTDNNHEDIPEVSPDGEPGEVSGDTKGGEAGAYVGKGESALANSISTQAENTSPVTVKLFSIPSSIGETTPKVVNAGDLIEYYALVTNVSEDDDINNVEIKFHIDNTLTTDLSTACYNLTKVPTAKNKKPIAGSSDYSARLEGNDVVFKANRIDWDSYVMFHITCTTAVEGKVSSRASVKSVGGTAYTGVESSAVYHEVRQEVSEFTLRTGVDGNNQYADGDRVFTYNFNLTKSGNGLNTSIPYDLMSGSSSVSKGTLTLENGIGTVSFPAKYTFKTEKMPTGVSYIVTHKADNNYTWNKDSLTGTTDLGGSSLSFTAVYKYVPVKYSLDTGIVVNMQGREFKPGDSFTYSVAPVNVGDPIFNRFPLPYGDGDTIAYFEESARIKPTSGSTATLPLQERLGRIGALVTNGCNSVYRTSAERNFYEGAKDCWCGYSVQPRDMNISHEMCFLYPGTYDYIVFQTAMYTDDAESIQQDTTQYKVTVKVTASGSNLTPSLTSVKKSTDGGETWKAISDKSKLTFTNTLKIDGVVKGDIDKSGTVDLDDLMICLEHVAEQKLLTGEAFVVADIDSNKKVDIDDLMRILDYVNEASTTL